MSNLIIIFGPPAVGKMTIGQEIVLRCGYKLLMNHHTIDPLLQFFDWGSKPFIKLNAMLRTEIMKYYAQNNSPGLIFTYLWDLNSDSDKSEIDKYVEIFSREGGHVFFVELEADINVRLNRNCTKNRIANKPSKRNIELSNERLKEAEKYKVNSTDDFIYRNENYLKINNTNLSPKKVADQIILEFELKEQAEQVHEHG